MKITFENINSIQNPTMDMLDETAYIVRAEKLIAEGCDVATAIENAVIDEHFDFINAREAVEKGDYEYDGVWADDEDGEIFVDVDCEIYTGAHAEELAQLAWMAYNDELNSKAEYYYDSLMGR